MGKSLLNTRESLLKIIVLLMRTDRSAASQFQAECGVGAEGFELECGPWNYLANKALRLDNYVPDFDAVGVAPLRVLRIRRPAFLACMEATSLQPVVNYQVTALP